MENRKNVARRRELDERGARWEEKNERIAPLKKDTGYGFRSWTAATGNGI